jgi:hypothetical protein
MIEYFNMLEESGPLEATNNFGTLEAGSNGAPHGFFYPAKQEYTAV